MKSTFTKICGAPLALALVAGAAVALTGCDNKREVLDVETPNGEIEVNQDRDTGEIDVETDND